MSKKNKSKNSTMRGDAFFRALMNNCIKSLIPVIGKESGKNYTGDEKIIQHWNEHFINQQDGKSRRMPNKVKFEPLKIRDYRFHLHKKSDTLGKSDKRIIDTLFSIIDSEGNETFFISLLSKPDQRRIIK